MKKNLPVYRIGDKTLHIKQWAAEWGISINAAQQRIYTMCGKKRAVPVRLQC